MCLIAFAIDAAPGCPLLIAANRDEDHQRPTAPLHRWRLDDGTEVLGGRDLRDGGTWMGVGMNGRIAMLTNVRHAVPEVGRRSRGELVARWLQGAPDPDALCAAIDPAAYAGFNLVVGELRTGSWAWIGNRDPRHPHEAQAPRLHTRALGAGVHTVSNASLDTPWPKTQRLADALQTALQRLDDDDAWQQPLTETLADTRPAQPHELPATGVPPDVEHALSSPFVRMPQRAYGTRSSTVLRWHADGRVQVDEWTHEPAAGAPHFAPPARRREWLTVA